MEFNDEIMALVLDGKGNVGKLLLDHEEQKDKIVQVIKKICSERTSTQAGSFITTKLIPALLTLSNAKVRQVLLDLCCELTRKHPINFLSRAEIQKFKCQIGSSYIANLETIRKSGDESWALIWQLLVRYLQEHLHTDVAFANAIFRIVEAAFRVSADRMGAYNCWIELIKNYQSSNETLLKTPRHIKLLVMPLKVKLALVDAVARKRFEVWTFLLKVLEESAIEVLEGFFNIYFCGNGKPDANNRAGLVRNTSLALCKGATEILLEILGHKKFCREINCWTSDLHAFNILITPENYQSHHQFIIKSAVQCCMALEKWADEQEQKQIATCLWTTLTALNRNLESSAAFEVKKQILDFLDDTIMSAYKDNRPLNMATIAVLELDVKQYAFGVFKKIFISQREDYKEALTMLLEQCKIQVDAKKVFKLGSFIFSEKDLKCDEDFFLMIWTVYQNFYYTSSHTNFLPKETANFLIAYVSIFSKSNGQISPGRKTAKPTHPLQVQSDTQWCELFNKLRVFQPTVISELSEIVKTAKNFYLLAPRFFDLLEKACVDDVNKREYSVLQLHYDVMLCVLDAHTSSFEDLANISMVTKVLLKANLKKFNEQQQAHLLNQIARCITGLIFKYKIYQLLGDIETFIKSLPIPAKSAMELMLYDPMFELSSTNTTNTAQSAAAVCKALKAKPAFQHPTIDLSRGAKITNMLRNSVATIKATKKTIGKKSPSTGEFPAVFGKSNEEYVPIDTQVKFDKRKLSAHQKEQLKKRKDDIPGMYVDLTQDTQSQSLSEDTSTLDGQENSKKTRKQKSLIDEKATQNNANENTKKTSPKLSTNKTVVQEEKQQTKTEDFTAILSKETPRVVLEHIDSTKITPEKTVLLKNGFGKESCKQVEMQENDEQIDRELEDFAASIATENSSDEVQPRKRGRPRGSYKKPKTANDLPENPKRKRGRPSANKPKTPNLQPQTPPRVTRRSATPIPTILTDRLDTASPVLQRELARLKIDACIEKILPGLEEISTNTARVTRSKKEQKPTETVTSPENNNTQVVESSQETIVHIKPLAEAETETKPKETEAKDTETCDAYDKFPVEVNVDLQPPVVPVLTPSLIEDAERDTESVEIDDENLPGSPITVETPTRTSELLSNTSEISPIRSRAPPLIQKTLEDYMESSSVVRTTPKTVVNCGNRSKKLVDLANNQQQIGGAEEERIVATPVRQEKDIGTFLTFSRELPSSSAIPAGGSILKRKKPDFIDDNSSPCVKRKRVNFPDPPTTSEKLIPVEDVERMPKKCKKQLIMMMNDSESVIEAQTTDNETDSDNLDVEKTIEEIVTESEKETVQSETATVKDQFEVVKNRWMKAISAIDMNNDNDVNVLKETLREIGSTVPPIIWGEYLQNIVREWAQLPRNSV